MNKKKIIKLGKIDYNGTGRKINAVSLNIEVRDWNGADEFAARAYVWNIRKSDIIRGGQCLEDLGKFPSIKNNPIYKEILRLWSLYHLKYLKDIPEPDRTKIYKLFE